MGRYWQARYWTDRYWPTTYWSQGSNTGSVASSLGNFTAAFNGSQAVGSYWQSQYWINSSDTTLEELDATYESLEDIPVSLDHAIFTGGKYWAANYWKLGAGEVEPVSGTGTYWSVKYWQENYWGANYWHVNPASPLSGSIAATLENASTLFAGESTYTQIFDLSVSVGIAWQVSVFDPFTGTIAVTLADATSAVTGTVLPPDSVSGTVNARIADASAAFEGTHDAPANSSGIISTTLGSHTASLTGAVNNSSISAGTIAAVLGNATSAFAGSITIPPRSGSVSTTLDDASGLIQGFSLEGFVLVGQLSPTVADFATTFTGTVTNPPIYEVMPYLIGSTMASALARIASLYCFAEVTGSTGTVTAQSVPHMSQVARGSTIGITLGGPVNSGRRDRRRGPAPYGSRA